MSVYLISVAGHIHDTCTHVRICTTVWCNVDTTGLFIISGSFGTLISSLFGIFSLLNDRWLCTQAYGSIVLHPQRKNTHT